MADDGADVDVSALESPADGLNLYTSDAALSFEEARHLTGRRGATLVLLLGEVDAGKTTLLVELWSTLLLRGSMSSHRLAGSRTALALEERAFYSRVESRAGAARTVRTHEQDDGFLHLRMCRPDGSLRELLLADITGEHFMRIREGTALLDELPWTGRIDRFLIIVDGKGYATPGEREVVLNRVQRQIHALRRSGAVNATARLAIALTKLDELSEDQRNEYSRTAEALLADVEDLDDQATSLLIAARPADGKPAQGLDDLIQWICSDNRFDQGVRDDLLGLSSRAVGRFTS